MNYILDTVTKICRNIPFLLNWIIILDTFHENLRVFFHISEGNLRVFPGVW
jgi:hypothetical protein